MISLVKFKYDWPNSGRSKNIIGNCHFFQIFGATHQIFYTFTKNLISKAGIKYDDQNLSMKYDLLEKLGMKYDSGPPIPTLIYDSKHIVAVSRVIYYYNTMRRKSLSGIF